MNITCSRKDLIEALDAISKIVPNKPQTPILSGVYMKAEGSALELQTNNFEIGMKIKIPVNTEKPGVIVVNARYLLEIVRKLSGEVVNIFHDEEKHTVNIKSDTADFNLLSMSAEDYPTVKSPETFAKFSLRASVLKNLIRKTAYACSDDMDSKPIFTGCYLKLEGNTVSMVATNTHRLAVMKETVSENTEDLSVVIPSKTVTELIRLLDTSNPSNTVSIECSKKNISFTFENMYITSRLIDGEFPPYEKVIPKSSDTIATIKVAEMKNPIERISLIAKETENKNIQFIFSQEGINISAYSPDIGRAEEKINAKIEGPDLTISFNYSYMTDVLKVLDSKEFVMKLTKPLSPADIREIDNDNFIYIMTPVRTY